VCILSSIAASLTFNDLPQITFRALIIGGGLGIFFAIVSFQTVFDSASSHKFFTCASDQCAACGDVCTPCAAKLLALSTFKIVL
jgi:hypothetical protein